MSRMCKRLRFWWRQDRAWQSGMWAGSRQRKREQSAPNYTNTVERWLSPLDPKEKAVRRTCTAIAKTVFQAKNNRVSIPNPWGLLWTLDMVWVTRLELAASNTPTAPCTFFASFLVRIVRFCKPNYTNNHIISVCSVYAVSRNGQFMWSKLPETASCFRGSPINKARESLILTFPKEEYIIISSGAQHAFLTRMLKHLKKRLLCW